MKLKHSEIKAEREKRYEEQQGECLVCRCEIDAAYAVLDHDHKTGRIRGVIHRDCNILLGKVENYTQYKGKRMATEGRIGLALAGMFDYMTDDYSDHPFHPKHLTADDKLRRKYERLRRRSKRPETKAKYTKLIEEMT